ncbi:hypothetical protein K1719_038889 [Acacia pycnantha]|nr:hypothetical protein K1719_038889 [Acacia pycnantha]
MADQATMADQAIMANQASMADQGASLPTTGQSASASVTNKASSVVTGKRKAMKQRSKVWDHFSKFVNEKGDIKGKCNYCEAVLACDPKNNGTTALNNHFVNACKKKPPPEELKQGHLNYSAEGDKLNLVNWKFDQDDWVQFALCKMHTRDVGEHLAVHIKEVLICLYNEYNQVITPSAELETGPSKDTQDLLDDDDPSLKLQKLAKKDAINLWEASLSEDGDIYLLLLAVANDFSFLDELFK